jgi:hypothetical protein
VTRSMQLHRERIATSTPDCQSGVLVVRRHHLLVRCSHWLNVPIVLGLILTSVNRGPWGNPDPYFVARSPMQTASSGKPAIVKFSPNCPWMKSLRVSCSCQ